MNDIDYLKFDSHFQDLNITWLDDNHIFGNFSLRVEDCILLDNENISLEGIKCIHHAPVLTEEAKVKALVLTIMAIISFIGNVSTIISIARNKRKSRSTVYTLIHQLSIADLFVTFACLTTEAIWTYTVAWIAGNLLCKMMKFLQMFSLYLSTFVLVLIGVDRLIAVRYPMRRQDTHRKCNYSIFFIWILSGILSIPQVSYNVFY